MKNILLTLAAITVVSSVAPTTFASPLPSSTGRVSSSNHSVASHASSKYAGRVHSSNYSHATVVNRGNYQLTHGTRFSNGYFYTGRSHAHWSCSRFDTRYGCTCYFDPCCECWYYWCQPASCYYPVTYCPYRTYCWE